MCLVVFIMITQSYTIHPHQQPLTPTRVARPTIYSFSPGFLLSDTVCSLFAISFASSYKPVSSHHQPPLGYNTRIEKKVVQKNKTFFRGCPCDSEQSCMKKVQACVCLGRFSSFKCPWALLQLELLIFKDTRFQQIPALIQLLWTLKKWYILDG